MDASLFDSGHYSTSFQPCSSMCLEHSAYGLVAILFLSICSLASSDLTIGAGGPGWRPGAEVLYLRDEERELQPASSRHAACGFAVLDANDANFLENFKSKIDEPMLIKNHIKHWDALTEWTLDWASKWLRDNPSFKVLPWNVWSHDPMRLTEVNIAASPSRLNTTPANYFEDFNAIDNATGTYKEMNALIFANNIECNVSHDGAAPLPPEIQQACIWKHIAMGAFGTGHGLHRHYASWSAQVMGSKSWYLMPPRIGNGSYWQVEAWNLYTGFPHEEYPRLANSYCGYKPYRQLYRDNLKFCVQGPGEAVFVPDFWWHATCSLNDTISSGVSMNISCDIEPGRSCDQKFESYGFPPPQKRSFDKGVMSRMPSPLLLLDSVEDRLAYPSEEHLPGVDRVFAAIDGYCWEEQWSFNIGDVKGALVEEIVKDWMKAQDANEPLLGVEFGSYLGYSAMRIAKNMPGQSKFLCVEPDYGQSPALRESVDQLLAWAKMEAVIKFLPLRDKEAISQFRSEKKLFDIIVTDHIKSEYLPVLKHMIHDGLLRPGSLFLADNVVLFSLHELLHFLRYSGEFDSYKLYYTEAEYDEYHGQMHPNGEYYPDGVVTAVWRGQGKGQIYEESDAAVCGDIKDCASCLSNLCSWCEFQETCVPDSQYYVTGCVAAGGRSIGLYGRNLKCRSSKLKPRQWVGPRDKSGSIPISGLPHKTAWSKRSSWIQFRYWREGWGLQCSGDRPVNCGDKCVSSCAQCARRIDQIGSCRGQCMWWPDMCVPKSEGAVVCGEHVRPNCRECPMGQGARLCQGDCQWEKEACMPKERYGLPNGIHVGDVVESLTHWERDNGKQFVRTGDRGRVIGPGHNAEFVIVNFPNAENFGVHFSGVAKVDVATGNISIALPNGVLVGDVIESLTDWDSDDGMEFLRKGDHGTVTGPGHSSDFAIAKFPNAGNSRTFGINYAHFVKVDASARKSATTIEL